MKKVSKIRINKIWGYEDWIYSPLNGHQTQLENGEFTIDGPLIKIIKTFDKLSIQVHPNDEQAQELENEKRGKAECWFVLEAHSDPFIVGLKTTNKNKIKHAILSKQWDSILEKIIPKKYDFINIPHGQVHGIPSNAKVLEIQQPSDITYRFYDYDRLQNGKLRTLHMTKALKCIQNIGWKLKPTKLKPLTFINDAAYIEFWDEPTITTTKSIVIDLESEIAFLCEKNEQINFENKYILIKLGIK